MSNFPRPKEEFARQVRDALAHLYNAAHLQDHPLCERLPTDFASGVVGSAQALRRMLLETIDELRPTGQVSYNAREWRPYRALFHRYVQRMPTHQVLEELAISARQYQREHAKALRAIVASLWGRVSQDGATPSGDSMDGIPAEARRLLSGARPEVLDVEKLVQSAVLALDRLARSRGVTIHVGCSPGLPPIHGDRGLLRQIMLNILSYLLAQVEGGSFHIAADRVKDDVHLVFSPEGAPVEGPAGAAGGISSRLALSQQLAEGIGGELRIEDSSIHLRLPLHQRVLLVIDDNQDLVRLFERYLADSHFRVVGANTAEGALALARRIKPLLITLDVMMPSHDGWEVLQTLKHNPETCDIPVAVCSILNESELAFSLGADDYVRKPVTQKDLIALLARWQRNPKTAAD